MLFGIRECADVVLRAKTAQKIGNKIFYKNEPVCYFETLKTSTFEGAATTVYAQGGKGNTRLMSWDGERTVTFTMEDALISPTGLAILTGAGLIDATEAKPVIQHNFERATIVDANGRIKLTKKPYSPETAKQDTIYVMKVDADTQILSEPYIYTVDSTDATGYTIIPVAAANTGKTDGNYRKENYAYDFSNYDITLGTATTQGDTVLVDYYTEYKTGAVEIQITPDKFGGNFYLEASTLWRDKTTGKDLPAEFIIPNCRVQSNFSFTLSSSGDPSTFTFTMDAFPDYTRFNHTDKVLADIQVLGIDTEGIKEYDRPATRTTDYDPEHIDSDYWDENSETIIRPEGAIFAIGEDNKSIKNGDMIYVYDDDEYVITITGLSATATIAETPTGDLVQASIDDDKKTITITNGLETDGHVVSRVAITDGGKEVFVFYCDCVKPSA